uniref:uncharacterized protein LOC122601253 n=1 Tax=Erigeron canadensis TaxID=72917 RepID=UPI001CB94D5C|nr:uncharacterized protein LOC122601253 [Erigeron canadensis]
MKDIRKKTEVWDSLIQSSRKQTEANSKSIAALERQVGQLAEQLGRREDRRLPSYTDLNQAHKPQSQGHVNMISSLRNGKVYDNKIQILDMPRNRYDQAKFSFSSNNDDDLENDDGFPFKNGEGNENHETFVKPPTQPKVGEDDVDVNSTPFPTALKAPVSSPYGKKGPKSDDMWEIFKQALTDFCTSINILPSSLVDRYELGSLKQTDIIIQLADRSTRIPRGILEDVIVKVEDFYYPVDFIVMDNEASYRDTPPPIILGRPLLVTIDARINCRTGVMDISFSNKKLRINIFNTLSASITNDCYAIDAIDE